MLLVLFFTPFNLRASAHSIIKDITIHDEIDHIYEKLKKFVHESEKNDNLAVYTQKDEIADYLREELIRSFKKRSRLFCFPQLDSDTFNTCIAYLHTKKQSCDRPDILLHTWSYLSGIKVIGLKNSSTYYLKNMHLKKRFLPHDKSDEEPLLLFGTNYICVGHDEKSHDKKIGDFHQHVPCTRKLLNSSVYYRKIISYKAIKEWQHIYWDFFKEELVPLSSFLTDSSSNSNNKQSSKVGALLDVVLRLNPHCKTTAMYSLGLVKLFGNTAVYLSQKSSNESRSKLISGPCLLSSTDYLGLQSGIFIETQHTFDNIIDYLFGCMLFRRGLFTGPTPPDKTLSVALYVPHYTLSFYPKKEKAINDHLAHFAPHIAITIQKYLEVLTLEEVKKLQNEDQKKFAKHFRCYVQLNVEEVTDQLLLALIEKLIARINNLQLQIPLIQREVLKEEFEQLLFEPEDAIDLSGKSIKNRFSTLISDDSSKLPSADNEASVIGVPDIIRHLTCYEYQMIKNIDLSGNSISDEGAGKLATALEKNIIPLLERLNLSENLTTQKAFTLFESLLSRYNFRYLILVPGPLESDVNGIPSVDPSLLNKVIWVPSHWIDTFKSQEKLDAEHAKHHHDYYRYYS